MLTNRTLRRIIILSFIVLVAMSFSQGIRTANTLAIIFSSVSLIAGIAFLKILGRVQQPEEENG